MMALHSIVYIRWTVYTCQLAYVLNIYTWWSHQMETFSALLAICAGNSPVPGEFPTQRPVTRSFDVYFDLRLSKRLSKQSWGSWFETPSRPLWRHRNDLVCSRTRWPIVRNTQHRIEQVSRFTWSWSLTHNRHFASRRAMIHLLWVFWCTLAI